MYKYCNKMICKRKKNTYKKYSKFMGKVEVVMFQSMNLRSYQVKITKNQYHSKSNLDIEN